MIRFLFSFFCLIIESKQTGGHFLILFFSYLKKKKVWESSTYCNKIDRKTHIRKPKDNIVETCRHTGIQSWLSGGSASKNPSALPAPLLGHLLGRRGWWGKDILLDSGTQTLLFMFQFSGPGWVSVTCVGDAIRFHCFVPRILKAVTPGHPVCQV